MSPTLFKKKFVNGLKRIAHVTYVKYVYKTLDFYKLSTEMSLFVTYNVYTSENHTERKHREKTTHSLTEIDLCSILLPYRYLLTGNCCLIEIFLEIFVMYSLNHNSPSSNKMTYTDSFNILKDSIDAGFDIWGMQLLMHIFTHA